MDPVVGSGRHTYHVNENWAQVPDGIEFKPAAVAVDSQDRVFAFSRSDTHPVVIFDRNGKYEGSWGAGLFKYPHAIRFNAEDTVWITDEYLGQFMLFTNDGKLLRTIGERGFRSNTGVPDDNFTSGAFRHVTHGGAPFNLPTDIATAPDLIDAVTATPAAVLQRPDLGVIAAGATADLTVVDLTRPLLQPLSDPRRGLIALANAADIDLVIVDGWVLVAGGHYTGGDEAALVAAGAAAIEKIWALPEAVAAFQG